jgi:hypothetical protein
MKSIHPRAECNNVIEHIECPTFDRPSHVSGSDRPHHTSPHIASHLLTSHRLASHHASSHRIISHPRVTRLTTAPRYVRPSCRCCSIRRPTRRPPLSCRLAGDPLATTEPTISATAAPKGSITCIVRIAACKDIRHLPTATPTLTHQSSTACLADWKCCTSALRTHRIRTD